MKEGYKDLFKKKNKDLILLRTTVRKFLKEVENVPFRQVDCNQSLGYLN